MSTQAGTYLELSGLAGGPELRTASFDGHDHLVVPVVALVGDVVVRPMNSRGPELVPAGVLERSVPGWNGRPVVPTHPSGGKQSANEPHVLEAMAFGTTFNARFDDGKLKLEAWLDPAKAKELGGDAELVVARVQEGDLVEVSVGAFVSSREQEGNLNGSPYSFIWSDIISDHLAMLPQGVKGACNAEMGCGAPRMNQAHEETEMTLMEKFKAALKGTEDGDAGAMGKLASLASQLLGMGQSDLDTRAALEGAIRAIEPGFEGVAEVFPEDGLVVYVATPGDEVLWLRRSFTLDDSGEVTLGDSETVEVVTSFEPIGAEGQEADTAEAAEGCPCNQLEGEAMSGKQKELIGRLIGCQASPFAEEDQAYLETLTEERLEGMLNTEPATADPTPMTEEEWLTAAPASLKALLDRQQANDEARKSHLVKALGKAQDVLTEELLVTKPLDELETLGSMLKVDAPTQDFSGRVAALSDQQDEVPEQPNPYTKALAASQASN